MAGRVRFDAEAPGARMEERIARLTGLPAHSHEEPLMLAYMPSVAQAGEAATEHTDERRPHTRTERWSDTDSLAPRGGHDP